VSDAPTMAGSVPLGTPPPADPVPGAPPGEPPSPLAAHPLSKVIDLPSGGLFYPDGTRQARIRPTDGEQEEMIASTPEQSPDRVRAIRQVAQQCSDLGGLPWDELLVKDFGYLCIHLFALSAGTDEVTLPDVGCDKDDCPLKGKVLSLTTMPCVYLEEGAPGDLNTVEELDPVIFAAMEAEKAMGEVEDDGLGPIHQKVAPGSMKEPFKCQLSSGSTVEWRLHRMKDLEAAEEFARATGDASLATGAGLGSFLSARQIVTVDGQSLGTVGALQWWRKTSSPYLREFRKAIRGVEFGFDMRPELRCPRGDCRRKVRVKLPNDGSMFRDRD